jgi:DNA-binding Xre family transcriptional regulator
MAISHMVRMALAHKNMREAELARSVGMTPAAFNYRMQIDKFSSEELGKIAKVLGAELTLTLEFPDGTNLSEHIKPPKPEPPPHPAGAENPKPGPKTRRSLHPAPEEPQEGQKKTALEKYEEALVERRRQEPAADWEFREKRYAGERKEREEGIELRRKLVEEHEELLRKRAPETSKKDDEMP